MKKEQAIKKIKERILPDIVVMRGSLEEMNYNTPYLTKDESDLIQSALMSLGQVNRRLLAICHLNRPTDQSL